MNADELVTKTNGESPITNKPGCETYIYLSPRRVTRVDVSYTDNDNTQ